jgi:hypothetical protein
MSACRRTRTAARKDGSLDTHAAVRALQAHGFSLEQAEGITEVVQDATASTPTLPELRQFVLGSDVKLEQLRTEMHRELGLVRSDSAALREEMRGQFALVVHHFTMLHWWMIGLTVGIAALLVEAFVLR